MTREPGRRRIVVADEDAAMAAFVISTLRADGHAVFHAYDGLSAAELTLGLDQCDLLISDTKVEGAAGTELIHQVRERRPRQAVIYIANLGRSTPEIERQLPADVTILREPFSAEELRGAVNALLPAPVATKRAPDDP